MKKKVLSIMLISMLSFGMLAGCGSGDSPSSGSHYDSAPPTSQDAGTQADSPATDMGYIYTANGVDVAVKASMEPIVAAWGEPDKYFESESCAFQGMDKVYTYGSVVISTYPENDKDYVLTIELKDDTITTAEGIYIGSSKADVTATYGAATQETDVALVYDKGDCQLSFFFEEDHVTNITYAAKMD